MKRILSLLMITVLIFAGLSLTGNEVAHAAGKKTKYVSASKLNVRSGPSTKYKVITTAKKHKAVTVIKTKGAWSQVKVNKKTGWVSSKYLKTTKSIKESKKYKVKYKTIKQNDKTLTKGKTKVVKNGKNGTRTKVYQKKYKNGKLISTKQISSKVTSKPVNKVIKVGVKPKPAKPKPKPTKPKPKYISSSQAKKTLSGVLERGGNTYYYDDTVGNVITVTVGSKHVSSIGYDPRAYQSAKSYDLKSAIEDSGEVEGKKIYDATQKEMREMEVAVRAAANSVYGSGTSQAKQLYNQIIKSKNHFFKKY